MDMSEADKPLQTFGEKVLYLLQVNFLCEIFGK